MMPMLIAADVALTVMNSRAVSMRCWA